MEMTAFRKADLLSKPKRNRHVGAELAISFMSAPRCDMKDTTMAEDSGGPEELITAFDVALGELESWGRLPAGTMR